MTNEYVEYAGRFIPRSPFRVLVYAKEGKSRLVESYDEFETALKSGQWWATKKEAQEFKSKKQGKGKRNGNRS